MRLKKHPKANLENYSKLFVQLGLVLSLAITYFLIQSKTYAKDIVAYNDTGRTIVEDDTKQIDYILEEPPKPKEVKPVVDLSKLDQKKDDEVIEETDFKIIDIDAPVTEPVFENTPIIEDPIIEDVPFTLIEDVPVFPGCVGNTNKEKRDCFNKKMNKFINKKFNGELANELGLSPGVQRIFTMFKIDKNGNIVDIKARAPHKKLQEEAIRVIRLLPKMKPGMQRKVAVGVKYSIPITFQIQ